MKPEILTFTCVDFLEASAYLEKEKIYTNVSDGETLWDWLRETFDIGNDTIIINFLADIKGYAEEDDEIFRIAEVFNTNFPCELLSICW